MVGSSVHIFGLGGRGHLEEMHITPGERSEPGDSVHITLLRRPRRGREHLGRDASNPSWAQRSGDGASSIALVSSERPRYSTPGSAKRARWQVVFLNLYLEVSTLSCIFEAREREGGGGCMPPGSLRSAGVTCISVEMLPTSSRPSQSARSE